MGAHGTLEEALANVDAFAKADAAAESAAASKARKKERSRDGKKDKKGKKEKKDGKESKRDRKKDTEKDSRKRSKDGMKAKEGRKDRKHGGRHDASPSDSGSSGSDGDGGGGGRAAGGMQAELARGRHAARCARELLLQYPDQRRDLRQLLWTVDQGQALDVSGVADAAMRGCLVELLSNLPLAALKNGSFMRRPGGDSVLTQLAGVFDETPAQLRSRAGPSLEQLAAPAADTSAAAASPPAAQSSQPAANGAAGRAVGAAPAQRQAVTASLASAATAVAGSSGAEASGAADSDGGAAASEGLNLVRDGSVEMDFGGSDEDEAGGGGEDGPEALGESAATVRPDIGPDCGPAIGPDFGPSIGPVAGPPTEDAPPEAATAAAEEGPSSPHGVPRYHVGPAMPPRELLEAAQEAARAMAAEEAERLAAEEAEDVFGPMPPDIIAEAEAAGADKPTAEVLRICRVLAEKENFLTIDKEDPVPDAYEVLGVATDVEAGAARRAFMKLSLWVHPDKSSHPRAPDAFHAADVAFKSIKDAGKRAKLDAAREDKAYRKAAIAQAEEQERARQWRVARGTATAEDLQGPIRSEPEGRGAWMTELPISRKPTAPSQVSVKAFSQSGVHKAVGQQEWTETPSQKLARLTAAAHAGPAALPAPAADAAQRRAAAMAATLDTYTTGSRSKSLVEQHAQRLAAEKKTKKEARKKRKAADAAGAAAGATGEGEDWEDKAPWRPFDRDRDLGISPAPTKPADVLKKAGSLSSRFGGGGGGSGRTFL